MESGVVRVLVVDDNAGDARLVEWSLAHEPDGSYHCERAGRIAEALDVLSRGPVDAVLLDLGLPDSTGSDGLRRIRERAPDAAVVVLTGSDDPLRVRDAVAAGAQDYQVKGVFPRGHLTRILKSAIRRQRLEGAIGRGDPVDVDGLNRGGDGEALALLEDGRPPVLNDAWVRLTGISREREGDHRAWLERLTAGAPVGDAVLDRPGAPALAVEYVVRPFGGGPSARRLVRIRDRFRSTTAGSGGTALGTAPGGVIDATAWAQLQELGGGDAAFVPALIDAFLEEAKSLVAELESGVAAGDRSAVERAAHRFKSGCAQVGALELAGRLGAIERAARTPEGPTLAEPVAAVVGSYPAVVAELERRRAGP